MRGYFGNGYGGVANHNAEAWEEIGQDFGRRKNGKLDHRGRGPLNNEGEAHNPYRDGEAESCSHSLPQMRDDIAARLALIPTDTRDLTSLICGDPLPCRSALGRHP